MSGNFKFNLMFFRKKKGLVQKQLAKELGIGAMQVCRYETGKSEPNLTMLVKMSKALSCSIDDLAGMK